MGKINVYDKIVI